MATVSQLVTLLFQSYEKQEQKERQDLYVALLRDVPGELLTKALKKCIQEKKYLPTVAEILEECRSLKETITGKKEFLDWDEAWEEIYKGWCSGSPYKEKPKWSTPEIAQVVERFGWLALLNAQERDTQTIRAQMKVMYETVCKRTKAHRTNCKVLGVAGVPKGEIPAVLAALAGQIGARKDMVKV